MQRRTVPSTRKAQSNLQKPARLLDLLTPALSHAPTVNLSVPCHSLKWSTYQLTKCQGVRDHSTTSSLQSPSLAPKWTGPNFKNRLFCIKLPSLLNDEDRLVFSTGTAGIASASASSVTAGLLSAEITFAAGEGLVRGYEALVVGARERKVWVWSWARSSAAGTLFSCPEKAMASMSLWDGSVVAIFRLFVWSWIELNCDRICDGRVFGGLLTAESCLLVNRGRVFLRRPNKGLRSQNRLGGRRILSVWEGVKRKGRMDGGTAFIWEFLKVLAQKVVPWGEFGVLIE